MILKVNCQLCKVDFLNNHKDRYKKKYCSSACHHESMRANKQDISIKMKRDYESNVVKSDGCWGWNGMIRKDGYGVINAGGHNNKILLHRASWMIHFGEIPKKMFILHKCDNHICSAPSHLFIGTQQDNVTDMISKGRRKQACLKGERNGSATITEQQAKEIKILLKDGLNGVQIGKIFNKSRCFISKIKTGKTWKHIKIEE